MLVFSRRENEAVIIGDNAVKITVVRICKNKVHLGIEADKVITVHRGEIYRSIKEAKNEN